jgi:hypothetical protein
MTDPLDEAEGKNDMRSMAVMTKAYYDGLREQGFAHRDALSLTAAWVKGVVSAAGGKGDA